ncbi:MAG: transcription antitermination factor NusB [Oscillospiraceae bacterium]|nr:transcription antitermination factor NusB [Oscillospiraceae bacterium]
MTRTNAREIVAQLVFAMGFHDDPAQDVVRAHMEKDYYETLAAETDVYAEQPDEKQSEYIEKTLCGIWDKQEELNGYIRKYAIGWSLERISKTARAIMQLAMYECLYVEDVPVSAAINEAVELTRKYEDEDVVAFVNGILGSFAREVAEQ